MQYSVPTNWQPDLVPALAGLPVAEIYGQLPRDFVGGGRASFLIGPVSRKQMRRHVRQVRDAGITFNYTLNATTMGNREWSIAGQRRLRALLDFIVDAGVDRVTVAIPFLLDLIKERHPELRVSVSTQTMVSTPDKARRWQELGADAITLSVLDVNRDFRALRAIRRAVSMTLQLIGNLTCLQGCPAGTYHAAMSAHASQTGMSPFVIDYCRLDCVRRLVASPVEYIRSGWIRPEDQPLYEEVGVDRIKLVTRGMRTAALAPIVRAYAEGVSPADLTDIFPGPSSSLVLARPPLWHLVRHYARPHRANLFRLRKLRGAVADRAVRIDSALLGAGFLEPFRRGVCQDVGCEACGHCDEVARRAVHVDPDARTSSLAANDRARDEILSGRLFRYLSR